VRYLLSFLIFCLSSQAALSLEKEEMRSALEFIQQRQFYMEIISANCGKATAGVEGYQAFLETWKIENREYLDASKKMAIFMFQKSLPAVIGKAEALNTQTRFFEAMHRAAFEDARKTFSESDTDSAILCIDISREALSGSLDIEKVAPSDIKVQEFSIEIGSNPFMG